MMGNGGAVSVWYAGLTMATRKTFKSVLDLHFTLKKKKERKCPKKCYTSCSEIAVLVITEKICRITFSVICKKKKKWQIHHLFQKKHDQKELYSTIVAVVEVVALFKDCFEQTSKWSLDVCK